MSRQRSTKGVTATECRNRQVFERYQISMVRISMIVIKQKLQEARHHRGYATEKRALSMCKQLFGLKKKKINSDKEAARYHYELKCVTESELTHLLFWVSIK